MNYNFLDSTVEEENIILPDSDKINPFLLKNNYADLIKAVDFFTSDEIKTLTFCFPDGKRYIISIRV